MNRPDQPQALDLDAIEARVNALVEGERWEADYVTGNGVYRSDGGGWIAEVGNEEDGAFIAAARTDVPALIVEVKRLRGEVADFQPDRDEWPYSAIHFPGDGLGLTDDQIDQIAAFVDEYVDAMDGRESRVWTYAANCLIALVAEVRRVRQQPQPDPLDESDHRDRVFDGRERLTRVGHQHWHASGQHTCSGTHPGFLNLAHWAKWGTITFADDPQTPPQATSATETALNRAALAEVAEQAHRLSQAICDLLDGES